MTTEFDLLLQEKAEADEAVAALHRRDHPMQAEYMGALVRACWAKSPKTTRIVALSDLGNADALLKFETKVMKILTSDEHEEVLAPFRTRLEALRAVAQKRLDQVKSDLYTVAPLTALSDGPKSWHALSSVWVSTYGSQTNARFYAESNAKIHALEAAMSGAEARVVEGTSFPQFNVEVLVASPRDVEVCRYGRGLSQREWVRQCWKLGANPRVFDPFLPHGFEERNGLDYCGNEKASTIKP